jgi:glycerate 2-kinase
MPVGNWLGQRTVRDQHRLQKRRFSPMTPLRPFLESLFNTAVAAAHPAQCLPALLPPPPKSGRLIVLAAGKAAGSMAEVAETHYAALGDRLAGIAVTRHGYARPLQKIAMVEAGHPVPDQAGLDATAATLALADSATADDLVLVLVSGGASANWIAPAEGLSLESKQALNRALLRSGANIGEINTVRKHLSRIKGGRLARHAAPARLVTIGISDVPGDDPAVIGSGPTVPDPTTLADARAIVARYGLALPGNFEAMLADPRNETPKPDDPLFSGHDYRLAVRPADVFRAVEQQVRAAGYDCIFLGDRLEGEAREVAATQARLARELQAAGRRAVILSGGELTVTIRGSGRGGPNQEFALALAMALDGTERIAALAADTDGTDGGGGSPQDPAGAYVDGQTVAVARSRGMSAADYLADNNSTAFFAAIGHLIAPGPTYTNVNDFRAIAVDNVDTR